MQHHNNIILVSIISTLDIIQEMLTGTSVVYSELVMATRMCAHLHVWPPACVATCMCAHLHVWSPACVCSFLLGSL